MGPCPFGSPEAEDPAESGPDKLVTEGVIDAPAGQVWAALCTREGLESWNVAHADVDLKVGGLMRHPL